MIADSAAAARIGAWKSARLSPLPASSPPITGPKANPSEKLAPNRPIALARFSGGEESAMKPCATLNVPPKKPLTTRIAMAIHNPGA